MGRLIAARAIVGLLLALGLIAGTVGTPARAQSPADRFPERTVRIVVPAAAGGGLDILMRAIARELSGRWSQPVVIENRAGASGIVGIGEVISRGGNDGHTLLATTDGLISNRFAFKNLPFDAVKDLQPVTLIALGEQLLVANSDFAANNLTELIALAQKDGARISYGSYGEGTQPHLVYGALAAAAGVQLTHVPYKGVAPVLVALAGNEVQLSVISSGTAGPLLKAGKLKVLAAASSERARDFPQVRTTAEQGFAQLQSAIWFGLMAPAGVPLAIIDKVSADVRAIVQEPAFTEQQINGKGCRLLPGGPKQFDALVQAQTPVMGAMFSAAGVKPQ
jgi:tripartite-type tricarboxylate transporter receptor subunit TctC